MAGKPPLIQFDLDAIMGLIMVILALTGAGTLMVLGLHLLAELAARVQC